MKLLTTLSFLFFSVFLVAQTPPVPLNPILEAKTSGVNILDSGEPRVIRLRSNNDKNKILFYLNGTVVSDTVIKHLDVDYIEQIDVKKDTINIEDKVYYGQVYIQTKDNFIPRLVSLSDLKEKHSEVEGLPTLFFIDDQSVQGNYDSYLIDEKNIETISTEHLQNSIENYNLILIRIKTRSYHRKNK